MFRPSIFRSIALVAAFSWSGCLDVTVKTTVSPDGSCDRTVTFTSKSRNVPGSRVPIPTDSTWKIEWVVRADSGDQYEYRAQKHFRTPEELAAEYPAPKDSSGVRVFASIERHFQWFYTYIDYCERFSSPRTYTLAPKSAFFTPEEGERYVRKEADSLVEQKVQRWEGRNYFELYVRDIASALRMRPDGSAAAEQLLAARDSIFARAMILLEKKSHTIDKAEGRLGFLAGEMNLPMIRSLRAADDSSQKHFEQFTKSVSGPSENRTNIVRMPGLLIDANSPKVSASTVTWTIDFDRLHVADAVMTARSRVVNVWAWWVTGAAGLVLVVLLLGRLVLRKR